MPLALNRSTKVTSVVIAVALGAVALGIARLINTRRPSTAPAGGPHIPAQIDRADFARPEVPVLVAVFTSATCTSCAAMLTAAREIESDAVAVDEIEAGRQRAVHDRYEIDAVPIAIVVDEGGIVRASFAGSVTVEDLRAAVAQIEAR